MATEPCGIAIKDCDCLDFPVSNYSVFQADVPVLIANIDYGDSPPLGNRWSSSSCLGIAESSVSQEDADAQAEQAAQACVWGTWKEPVFGDGYASRSIFQSAAQTCTVACPDGSQFHHSLDSGAVLSTISQEDADTRAAALCIKQANARQFCFEDRALDEGCINELYSELIRTSRADVVFSYTGSLPTGVELDSDGIMFGIPTVAGAFPITVTATSAAGDFVSKSFTVQIVEITSSATLPAGALSTPYSQQLTETGGTAPLNWQLVGSLPPGLTLSESGLISGTPTDAGVYAFTVILQTEAT